jgi:eukaryotic-like serine/threonine-protein kinase
LDQIRGPKGELTRQWLRTFSAISLNAHFDRKHKLSDHLQETDNPPFWKIGYSTRSRRLPSIRAYVEIHRHNPEQALKLLEAAASYDLAFPQPLFEEGGLLYPPHVRGQAFLLLQRGKEAANEFQKFLDYRGVVINSVLAALARSQLARALSVSGDSSGARKAYQDFFSLWKEADPDIPILKQAKAEYAKLQ